MPSVEEIPKKKKTQPRNSKISIPTQPTAHTRVRLPCLQKEEKKRDSYPLCFRIPPIPQMTIDLAKALKI